MSDMAPIEMYEKGAFLKRIQKLGRERNHERLHLLMRLLDEIKTYLSRAGGRSGLVDLQFAIPWITLPYIVPEIREVNSPEAQEKEVRKALAKKKGNPKIPHKDLQLHHITNLRDEVYREYQKVIGKLRLDLDDGDDL